MTPAPHRGAHARLDLTGDAGAAASARAFVRLHARSAGLAEEYVEDLPQAVAELLAAAAPAHRPTTLLLHEGHRGLTLRVDFAGSGVPDVAEETVSLLSALSRQWGWRRLPGALQLWCRVPLGAEAGGSPHRRRRAHGGAGNSQRRAALSSS